MRILNKNKINKKKLLMDLSRKLIKVYLPGWKVRATSNMDFFGECLGDEQVIELSIPLGEAGTLIDFIETVLHEIAHGLTWKEKIPHGPKWKRMCKLLGCSPFATSGSKGIKLKRNAIKSLGTSCKNK
jgi:SprT-like family protein